VHAHSWQDGAAIAPWTGMPRYTYHEISITPLWHTKRRVAGGTCIDILVHDKRSTITHATVNAANIKEVRE
jgi:hypothetical protein